jgi:kynurenine formamidase
MIDVVFVRTGYWKRRSELGPIFPPKDGTPGPHPDITNLLHERQAAMFSSDTW